MKLHKVMIIGNLGRDPKEVRLPSGSTGSVFPVAVNDEWTDSNGNRQKDTTWYTVRVSNNQAEACNRHLKKGRKVLVEGKMRSNDWGNPRIWFKTDDTERADPRTTFELLAWTVEFGENPQQQSAVSDSEEFSSQDQKVDEPTTDFTTVTMSDGTVHHGEEDDGEDGFPF